MSDVKLPTPDEAIEEKIQVLKDFYVINNRKQEESVRAKLKQALANEPRRDPYIVLDRVARVMILERLGGVINHGLYHYFSQAAGYVPYLSGTGSVMAA